MGQDHTPKYRENILPRMEINWFPTSDRGSLDFAPQTQSHTTLWDWNFTGSEIPWWGMGVCALGLQEHVAPTCRYGREVLSPVSGATELWAHTYRENNKKWNNSYLNERLRYSSGRHIKTLYKAVATSKHCYAHSSISETFQYWERLVVTWVEKDGRLHPLINYHL